MTHLAQPLPIMNLLHSCIQEHKLTIPVSTFSPQLTTQSILVSFYHSQKLHTWLLNCFEYLKAQQTKNCSEYLTVKEHYLNQQCFELMLKHQNQFVQKLVLLHLNLSILKVKDGHEYSLQNQTYWHTITEVSFNSSSLKKNKHWNSKKERKVLQKMQTKANENNTKNDRPPT